MRRFFNQLIPFIFIGIALVAFAFGIFLLSYLFLLGAIVGLMLFAISWIRDKFFRSKNMIVKPKKKGRIIDSSDWKEL